MLTHGPPQTPQGDWDIAMQETVQREAVDLLRHQLEVERQRRASLQRNDLVVALSIVGLSMGFGLGARVLPVIGVPKRRSRGR